MPLLDFLLQPFEKIRLEKVFNRHVKTITELFDRGNRDALVPAADDVVDRRLRYAAHGAELVDGNIPFSAELQNTLFYSFANVHRYHLEQMIPIFSCKV